MKNNTEMRLVPLKSQIISASFGIYFYIIAPKMKKGTECERKKPEIATLEKGQKRPFFRCFLSGTHGRSCTKAIKFGILMVLDGPDPLVKVLKRSAEKNVPFLLLFVLHTFFAE